MTFSFAHAFRSSGERLPCCDAPECPINVALVPALHPPPEQLSHMSATILFSVEEAKAPTEATNSPNTENAQNSSASRLRGTTTCTAVLRHLPHREPCVCVWLEKVTESDGRVVTQHVRLAWQRCCWWKLSIWRHGRSSSASEHRYREVAGSGESKPELNLKWICQSPLWPRSAVLDLTFFRCWFFSWICAFGI